MLPRVADTIVAVASASGVGARAIVRLSGPRSLAVVNHVFGASFPDDQRQLISSQAVLPGVHSPLPADVYIWPGPRTYTGQDLVEIHTPGSLPLVHLLVARLLDAGARAAQPGEFTMRAFLAGKLDLTRAEAVLAVIDSDSRDELHEALTQLAGGITRPLHELREDLLNLLADVEAGLDFTDENIRFVDADELFKRIGKGLALLAQLRRQIEQRALGHKRFRAVLVGKPNAGKSTLFNALAGAGKALVSPVPGTTRDYLVHKLEVEGVAIDLVDTAGVSGQVNGAEGAAQARGKEQADRADLILLCAEPRVPLDANLEHLVGRPSVLAVATKCDLDAAPPGWLATSAVAQTGLAELKRALAEKARAVHRPALAPSLSRCRHHLEMCWKNLQAAHHGLVHEEPPEILALELRGALEELGAVVGTVYTDDLLDRVFTRFCIGK